jgi:hypothetical protein
MDGVFYSLDAIWSLIALRWATMDRAARVPARVQPKETLKFLQILQLVAVKSSIPRSASDDVSSLAEVKTIGIEWPSRRIA